MPVTKTTRECFEVRENREWANISLRCWDRPACVGPDKWETYYCGEIAIHSSFGTWGHTWTACGKPFKQFLISSEFDYLFTKFMGAGLEHFDGDATLAQIKGDVTRKRRMGELAKDEAREAWDLVKGERERIAGANQTEYGYAMWAIGGSLDAGHPMRNYFNDPAGWPWAPRHDQQAAGFWKKLWPAFVDALRQEVEVPREPERAEMVPVSDRGQGHDRECETCGAQPSQACSIEDANAPGLGVEIWDRVHRPRM